MNVQVLWTNLGRQAYQPVLQMQHDLIDRIARGQEPPRLLLVEHDPPVITLGRGGGDKDVLASPEALRRAGVEIHTIARGGRATYHGPGQLVGYPLLPLDRLGLGLHEYLRRLEEVILRTLALQGLPAGRVPGKTGVWVDGSKIASIGIAVRRWVSYHGFAINVSPNLDHFGLIVPCGLQGVDVTSLERLTGRHCDAADLHGPLLASFAEVFGAELRECRHDAGPMAPPPAGDGTGRQPWPRWLKIRRPAGGNETDSVGECIRDLNLATVCSEAHCPNRAVCAARGTATFLILGRNCTRSCGFCAVPHASPQPLDASEPQRVAEACRRLALRHVVITSVTRDDLSDGGARHFAATIAAVRRCGHVSVEVLVPDFGGHEAAIQAVLAAGPDVLNHNIETVPRLYPAVRPQASYVRSLELLARSRRQLPPQAKVKSGLMLGLGEDDAEVVEAMRDLRNAGCDMLTLGQYLSPSGAHLPVARFVAPEEFDLLRRRGLEMGFAAVAAGPLVRSSYGAEDMLDACGGSR